jgi:hypothetical protein
VASSRPAGNYLSCCGSKVRPVSRAPFAAEHFRAAIEPDAVQDLGVKSISWTIVLYSMKSSIAGRWRAREAHKKFRGSPCLLLRHLRIKGRAPASAKGFDGFRLLPCSARDLCPLSSASRTQLGGSDTSEMRQKRSYGKFSNTMARRKSLAVGVTGNFLSLFSCLCPACVSTRPRQIRS